MNQPGPPFPERPPEWLSPAPVLADPERRELESVRAHAERTTGWLSEAQGLALYHAARRTIDGDVLEIGSFCGKSTLFLALACKHDPARFFAVDPHKAIPEGGKEQFNPDLSPRQQGTWGEFCETMARSGLQGFVTPVVATSAEARRQIGPLRLKLAFIDGSHEYDDVLTDFDLWSDLIVPGGYLVFHDSNFESVGRVISERVCADRYAHEGTVGAGGWAMTVWRRLP